MLMTWGSNGSGKLGDNTTTNRSSPVQTIAYGANWKQVSVSNNYSAAIKTDGTLWCWGFNYYGQIGDNTVTSRSSPVQTVVFGTNWKQVACGPNHTAAIKTDGTLWTWGENYGFGKLGDNTATKRSSPVQTVAGGSNWKQVSATYGNTAAIKTDGTLWLWGQGVNGQLGDNFTSARSSPVQTVTFGTNWNQVSCGPSSTAAIKKDGTLWCWGNNNNGQLGDNTVVSKSSPVQTVVFGTNWKQVSCGPSSIAAIKTDGTLWSWGRGIYGELGDNTAVNKSSPVQTIAIGTNWKQISCGSLSIAAIKTDGTLWSWGSNYYGGIGDNTVTNRSSPVQTIIGGNTWKFVSTYNQTAAIKDGDF
jgi:alpha-tubulin suppressor-like RCC1 family protein